MEARISAALEHLTSVVESRHDEVVGDLSHRVARLSEAKETVALALHSSQSALRSAQENAERLREELNRERERSERSDRHHRELAAKQEALERRVASAEAERAGLESKLGAAREEARRMTEVASAWGQTIKIHERVAGQIEKEGKNSVAVAKSLADEVEAKDRALKRQAAEISELRAQLRAQEEETLVAQRIIDKTSRALDLANAAKKVVVHQWQEALDSMSVRDNVLDAVRRKAKEAESSRKEVAIVAQALEEENSALSGQMSMVRGTMQQMEARMQRLDRENAAAEKEKEALASQAQRLELVAERAAREERAASERAAKLIADNDRLRARVNVLEGELSSVRKAAEKAVMNAKTDLRQGNLAAVQTSAAAQRELREQQIKLSEVEQERARLAVAQLALAEHAKTLTAEHQASSKRNAELQARLEALWADTSTLAGRLDHKSYEIDSLKARLEKETESARLRGGEESGKAKAELRAAEAALARSEAELKSLRSTWNQTQLELVRAKNEAERLAGELDAERRSGKIASLLVNRVDGDTARAGKERDEALVELETMRVQLTKFNWEIATLRQRNLELEQERELSGSQGHAEKLEREEELRNLRAQLTRVEETHVRSSKEAAERERRVGVLEAKVKARQERLDKARARGEALEAELAHRTSELKAAQSDVKKLSAALRGLQRNPQAILSSLSGGGPAGATDPSRSQLNSLSVLSMASTGVPSVAVAKLEHENTAMRERYYALTQKLLNVDNELAGVSQDNHRMRREITSLRTEYSAMEARFRFLQSRTNDPEVLLALEKVHPTGAGMPSPPPGTGGGGGGSPSFHSRLRSLKDAIAK
jgi:chromosome segregation ATPase